MSDTGNATARGGRTAVSGPRAPGDSPAAHVQITRTGNAIAAHGGLAVSGYLAVDSLTYVQPPRAPAPWPHQVGVLPPRAQSFQPRDAAEQLREAVDATGTVVLSQVLSGMGGVGKTQLAAEYARGRLHRGDIDVLVWITASARTAIVQGYAQAAHELLAIDADPPQAAAQFLAWLEPKPGARPCRWLVVLDDVADPADLRGLRSTRWAAR